ncbi:hypothetical protein DPMN_120518 [Dreissena polymorpha]|uniref:Secreted protein n=1 Tax=Dreissena polymorpha TaxID=45954 RepID=A0A9D4GRQ5_DREPO|nr:hypothetical protein DPMN_120518 [Dreissena polymorpha]
MALVCGCPAWCAAWMLGRQWVGMGDGGSGWGSVGLLGRSWTDCHGQQEVDVGALVSIASAVGGTGQGSVYGRAEVGSIGGDALVC